MNIYLLIILILCVLVIPIFYQTKRFYGFWGILTFVLGLGALFTRLLIQKNYPLLGFFNRETITGSALLIFVPAGAFILFSVFSKRFGKRIKNLEKLLLPYVLFGGLQQIFFFWVFSDSVFYLSKNPNLTFILTVLFFTAFHFTGQFPIKKFLIPLVIFAIIDTWVYLIWGNIIPQIIVHGLIGSILYTVFTDTDQVKRRLG